MRPNNDQYKTEFATVSFGDGLGNELVIETDFTGMSESEKRLHTASNREIFFRSVAPTKTIATPARDRLQLGALMRIPAGVPDNAIRYGIMVDATIGRSEDFYELRSVDLLIPNYDDLPEQLAEALRLITANTRDAVSLNIGITYLVGQQFKDNVVALPVRTAQRPEVLPVSEATRERMVA